MTQQEKMRLNEIIFCNLFKALLKKNSNPVKVYDFITALAEVLGASTIVLNNILTTILNNDKRYIPTKQEYIFLLKKAGMSVRQITKLAHISFTTYYHKKIPDMHIEAKFDPIQYAEMMKVLKFFVSTIPILEGGGIFEH